MTDKNLMTDNDKKIIRLFKQYLEEHKPVYKPEELIKK